MALAGRLPGNMPGAACMRHTPRPPTLHIPCSPASTSSSSMPSMHCSGSAARSGGSRCALLAPHAGGAGDRPGSSSNGGRPSNGNGGSGGMMPRRSKPDRKARKPGQFEIKVMTPPPSSLGVYALPPNTHNGEEIEIDGQGYVVTSLVLKYKLHKGRYVRDHSRLEVQPTSRYFLNMMLDNLVHGTYIGPADYGSQD